MSLDAHTIHALDEHEVDEEQIDTSMPRRDSSATSFDDDLSCSSYSNWTSRRDSLATNISQSSSAATSAACPASCRALPSHNLQEEDLGATLKQGLGIQCHDHPVVDVKTLENRGDKSPLVPSTFWASSLIKIRPPRSSSILSQDQNTVTDNTQISQPSKKTSKTLPVYLLSPQEPSIRSKLPTFANLRRPSDTPSISFSSFSSLSSSPVLHSTSPHQSPNPSSPILQQRARQASLASFSINRLRSTKSTPLLRRKGSSNQLLMLPTGDEPILGGDDTEKAKGLHGLGMDLGYGKGSLPEVPMKGRYEPGMIVKRRSSFLPASLRRKS